MKICQEVVVSPRPRYKWWEQRWEARGQNEVTWGHTTDETWLWTVGSEHSLWIQESFMVNYVKGNMLTWVDVNYSVSFIQFFENME